MFVPAPTTEAAAEAPAPAETAPAAAHHFPGGMMPVPMLAARMIIVFRSSHSRFLYLRWR